MAASIAKRSGSLLALLLVVGGAYLLWGLPATAPREAPSPAAPESRAAVESGLPTLPPLATEEREDPRLSTDAAPEEEAAEAPAPARSALRLQGRVIDSFDAPVSEVIVSAYRGPERLDARTDAAGRFAFDELRVGQYRLLLDPRSLGEGLLAPWRQNTPRPWTGEATGIHGTSIALTAGDDIEVELRVHRAGVVRARFAGPDGAPLVGVELHAHSVSGLELRGRSDELGQLRIDGAYPGSYMARAQPTGDGAARLAGLAPLPFAFDLEPGTEVDLGALAFESGGPVVAGRVVDSSGLGAAGLALSARATVGGVSLRWAASTDEEGRFRIGRLPAQSVTLELDPAADRFESPPAPIVVDLSASPELYELPDWRVELEQRYSAFLHVEVDRAWLRREGIVQYGLELRETGGAGEAELRVLESSAGGFEWSCATPRAPLDLEVVLIDAGGGEHARRQRIAPVAGTREELVFRFP